MRRSGSGALPVVFVHVGGRPPAYLRTSARQARRTGGPVQVVGPRAAARLHGAALDRFRRGERLSELGLGGFWRHACERFFVLEEHMRSAGLARAVHAESDNLVYAPPHEYQPWLAGAFGDGIAVCPLTGDEDTAAVMYVGSLDALTEFNAALLELAELGSERLLATYGGRFANEMRMLHVLRTEAGLAAALPTTPEAAVAAGAPCLFDPAGYGQLVDGIPARPGVPFTSQEHVVGRGVSEGRYALVWDAARRRPLVQARGGEALPLVNLHVHSKRLGLWLPQREPLTTPAGRVRAGLVARARRLRRR